MSERSYKTTLPGGAKRTIASKISQWTINNKGHPSGLLFHFVERYKINGLIFYVLLHCDSKLHFYRETAKVLTQMSPASDLHRLSQYRPNTTEKKPHVETGLKKITTKRLLGKNPRQKQIKAVSDSRKGHSVCRLFKWNEALNSGFCFCWSSCSHVDKARWKTLMVGK